jgi:hypothetical protein
MNKVIQNILGFIAICLLGYIVMDGMNVTIREGFSAEEQQQEVATTAPGIAGNAATYASTLKAQSTQMQDTFLISKYRSNYENIILDMLDFVNDLMMNTVLSANATQSQSVTETLQTLTSLSGAQTALNNVMKFIDAN